MNPGQGLGARIADWFVGSKNAGAEYAKNKSAADKPGEIVVVPLVVDYEDPKTGKKKKYDMRGTGKGTLNFSPPQKVRDDLRGMTEEATKKQIAADGKRRAPANSTVTRRCSSRSARRAEDDGGERLRRRQGSGEPARAKWPRWSPSCRKGVKKALGAGQAGRLPTLQDKNVSMALDELDKLAGSEKEYQGYVGRELGKKADLDLMLEAAQRSTAAAPARRARPWTPPTPWPRACARTPSPTTS